MLFPAVSYACLIGLGAGLIHASEIDKKDSPSATEARQVSRDIANGMGEWFERYAHNPLSIPQDSALGVVHPDVLFFPDGRDGYRFWMFYTPYPPPARENPCLARSADGLRFDDSGLSNPLIVKTEPWEGRHLADVDVIKVDSTWYMYYVGINSAGTGGIGLALSADGKNWTKYAHNPIICPTQSWENNWVGAPAAYHDGRKFWIWFSGGFSRGIELASSSDGISWVRENDGAPVLTGTPGGWDAGGVTHPSVIGYRDTLWMYYLGFSAVGTHHDRLGLAKSVDKLHWTKCGGDAVLDTVQHGWEGYHIYRASPVIIQDTMWLYYSAYNDGGPSVPHIGRARSYSFVRGDADGDGAVGINDAVVIINYIFAAGPGPTPPPAGDTNCDGAVNAGDAVRVINYVYRGGPAPDCP